MSRSSQPNVGEKKWSVGSLTYTSGGLVVLFCWLLWGDFAWSMRDRSIPAVLQLLLKKFEASDALSGLLIGSLPAGLALVLGPIISYKSDRHRGRWGRRIPFLLIPTPIAVLAMLGMAFSPRLGLLLHEVLGDRSPGTGFLIIACLGGFWTLFEFASIVANSVFGGLVNDVVPQAVIGRFFGMFRALSLIAGIIFNFWMLGKAETHYIWIFIGIAALYGLGFSAMCLKVKEGDYPPPPEIPGRAGGFLPAVKTYFRDCFSKPYYLWFFAAMALSGMAIAPINTFSVFFAKSVRMEMDTYGKYLALTYGFSLVLAYPLGILADKFHPLRLSIVALFLYAAVMFAGGLFAKDASTFGYAFVAHGLVAGIYFTASASIGQRLLPRSRFAELGSAGSIVGGLSAMIVAPSVGLFLDYNGHVYRYIFYISFVIALGAILALLVLHRKFMQLGGPKCYQAPA